MTDTTADNANVSSDIKTLKEEISGLKSAMSAFSDGMVAFLTGQQTATPAKRRGRPPKAETLARQAAPAKEEPLHPTAIAIADIVKRTGRVTQTAIAKELEIERSLVANHKNRLLEDGLVVVKQVKRRGQHLENVFYRPDWAAFKGE